MVGYSRQPLTGLLASRWGVVAGGRGRWRGVRGIILQLFSEKLGENYYLYGDGVNTSEFLLSEIHLHNLLPD